MNQHMEMQLLILRLKRKTKVRVRGGDEVQLENSACQLVHLVLPVFSSACSRTLYSNRTALLCVAESQLTAAIRSELVMPPGIVSAAQSNVSNSTQSHHKSGGAYHFARCA